MVDTKTESEIRDRIVKGICYVKGCGRPGKTRVQVTFASETEVNGNVRLVQTLVSAWACDDYMHRGGR